MELPWPDTAAALLQGNLELCVSLQLALGIAVAVVAGLVTLMVWSRKKSSVLVLDFAVHKPEESWNISRSRLRELIEASESFTPECIEFQDKIAYRTGLGDATAVPPAVQTADGRNCGIDAARFEYNATCFQAIQEVLNKTAIKPKQVKFVITNSSLFNPTPSLSAAIINHFKMPASTINYSLGGMGCSAGVIAMDLARELLGNHPNSIALVVSHENITMSYYTGKDRSMLIPNCLFRSNGAAVLLSNRPCDAGSAKYSIKHLVRTNLAADDVAFNCVMQTEDDEGKIGVRLNKDLIAVGARALRHNMTSLGPLVLPLSEQLTFAANYVVRQACKHSKALTQALPVSWTKAYTPDFKKAFDFYCIHTGGRGIIDGLEKEMSLSRQQVEPSRASLYRFGNTSSTSVWYELAYIESMSGVKTGQRVWQLAFGSGFKFNSAVLVANRNIRTFHPAWDGFDSNVMWCELDKLEAESAAARAAKAAKLAAAKATGDKGAAGSAAAVKISATASSAAPVAPPAVNTAA